MSEPMKVVTVWQPHATLIALGIKPIETRSWSTKYRGPLAIHAAARTPSLALRLGAYYIDWGLDPSLPDGEGFLLVDGSRAEIGDDCLSELLPADAFTPLSLGSIVATATLVDVVPISGSRGDMDRATKRLFWTGHVDGHLSLEDYRTGRTDNVEDQRPYGDFTPGRFAWLLADIVPVDPPVPFKGGQGLSKTWEP